MANTTRSAAEKQTNLSTKREETRNKHKLQANRKLENEPLEAAFQASNPNSTHTRDKEASSPNTAVIKDVSTQTIDKVFSQEAKDTATSSTESKCLTGSACPSTERRSLGRKTVHDSSSSSPPSPNTKRKKIAQKRISVHKNSRNMEPEDSGNMEPEDSGNMEPSPHFECLPKHKQSAADLDITSVDKTQTSTTHQLGPERPRTLTLPVNTPANRDEGNTACARTLLVNTPANRDEGNTACSGRRISYSSPETIPDGEPSRIVQMKGRLYLPNNGQLVIANSSPTTPNNGQLIPTNRQLSAPASMDNSHRDNNH